MIPLSCLIDGDGAGSPVMSTGPVICVTVLWGYAKPESLSGPRTICRRWRWAGDIRQHQGAAASGDQPGFVAEKWEQCHDCRRLIRPGQRKHPKTEAKRPT